MREGADSIGTAPVKIKSLELVNLADHADLDRRIRSSKAPTAWLRDAGYGLMFQWGEWSYPKHGPKKAWPKMVEDFDVEPFARMVGETGAGYVIWSATWATFYFPAPIHAIDRILPGHTSRRDLIGELAEALGRRGIKLMVYYHEGWEQKDWWERNWDPADPEEKKRFVSNLCSVLDEVGNRYGPKVAGLLFDDGMAFYPAPFEQITRAAKAGNRDRLVSYNSWVLPKLTDFQDLYFGEGFKGNDATGADGLFFDGPYKGLFAHGMFILDGPGWGVDKPDLMIRAPLPAVELISTVTRAMQHRQSLSLNLLMYEDGSVSPESMSVLKALHSAVRVKRNRPRMKPKVPE